MTYILTLIWLFGLLLHGPASLAQEQIPHQLRREDGAAISVLLSANWNTVGCGPTLILSHGMGGSEKGLGYVSRAAQSAGYRVMNVGHRESGPKALRSVFVARDKEKILLDPVKWQGREKDLRSAIAFSRQGNCRPTPFILGGHSMGAALTILEAGAVGKPPFRGQDRFDAYIAISPQGTGWVFGSSQAWRGIKKPVLMITGTEDNGFDGNYTKRLEAWTGLPPGQKRLGIIEGATHLSLGGRGKPETQDISARLMIEYLEQLKTGWRNSSLFGTSGLQIREK